jgi:hypothetical protein
MSIRVFASGTGDFHFTKTAVTIGDIYDAAEVAQFLSNPPRSLGQLAQNRAEAAAPDPMRTALEAYGKLMGLHIFELGISMALIQFSEIKTFFALRETHLLWPTTGDNVSVTLSTGDANPTGALFRRLRPVLEDTGMNGFGALAAIGEVFDAFSRDGGPAPNGECRIMLQLTS